MLLSSSRQINSLNSDLFLPKSVQLVGFLWNGIFAVAIANACWVTALKKGNTAKISNLAYITPFVSSIWTALFLKEKITINLMAGLIVIIMGVFIQLKDNKTE